MPLLVLTTRIFEHLPVFALVLFRIGGLVAAAPLFSSSAIPARVKLLIVLMLALAVFPVVAVPAATPTTLAALVLAVGGELLIGLAMGFVLSLLFQGIQIGAELVSQQMGLSFAQLVDPLTQNSSNVLSEFYLLLSTVIYLLVGGHVALIRALMHTFETVPLLRGPADALSIEHLVDTFLAMLQGAFMLGVRVAGPALAAIFLATLALGFISRTMPQLNILAAGFPIRIVLSLILLVASLGTVCWVFQENLAVAFGVIHGLFVPGGA